MASSEVPGNIPSTEQVRNWLRHDQDLLEGGATVNHLGHFTITQQQYNQLHGNTVAHEQAATPHAEPSHEFDDSGRPERVNKWINVGAIDVMTWLDSSAKTIPSAYRNGQGPSRFMHLSNENAHSGAFYRLPKIYWLNRGLDAKFVQYDISEVVTIVPLKGSKFGEFNQTGVSADEEAVLITYETLSGGPRTKFRNGLGNILQLTMVLPQSEASAFTQLLQEDPSVIRDLTDSLMVDKFQAGQPWEKARPPYKQWEELNGGINRIALRHDFRASAEQSQIFEF